MKINILEARMTHSVANGYLGHVRFAVEGHKQPYELTLQSDESPHDWNYSLHFDQESGVEEEIEAVVRAIEENDEIFDRLVDAALEALKRT